MLNKNTAISIIIPMYNVEKYIRQCLISVLSQKFQDYEVIIVDDCSKDNSVAEVENLRPHFGNRLQLIRRDKQSGGAGIPRNQALKAAHGKYITCLDSDDMFLPTALKDFYEIAEETDADVLHTEKVLVFEDDGIKPFRRDELKLASNESGNFVEKVTFETNDLAERIRLYHKKYFFWTPWGKFFKRSFLVKNNINFPKLKMSEDMIFCFKCLCLAKNYVRIPNITNIYRARQNSMMRNNSDLETEMNKWISVIVDGSNLLDEFMNTIKFFNDNLESRYLVMDFFIKQHFGFIKNLLSNLKPHEIEYFVYKYLAKNKISSPALTAYLFSNSN